MCDFMNTIKQSLTLNLCLTNFVVISFIMQSTNLTAASGEISTFNQVQNAGTIDEDTTIMNDFKQLKSKIEQYLKEIANSSNVFDLETGLLVNDNEKLVDHNDKDVLYHWDTPKEQEAAKQQYNLMLEEQKRLLRLRNIVIRFVFTCLNSCFDEDNVAANNSINDKNNLDFYKKSLLEFDYTLKNKQNLIKNDDLSDNSEEDIIDSDLKIYITKSNYLKRWSQLNLDKILNTFISLSSELSQDEKKFLDKEQENNQINLKQYRDSLKDSFQTLKKRLSSILNVFDPANPKSSSNFKIELVSRLLECFSSSLECFSFILTVFTLCLSAKHIKPIWTEKLKKSKKKKTLYNQYAASIDILFEIHEMLCQILNFFVSELKQKVCQSITNLIEARCSNVSSTLPNAMQSNVHLNDIAVSYLKSFNELRNFFNAKLKYLLKFSGNVNVQLEFENLKLN